MTLHVFLLKLVNSGIFRGFIMSCILINTLTTAFYASYSKEASRYITEMEIIEMMDSLFLAIYTMEFVLKFSVKPRAFFFNGFNCFDFVVLILSYSQVNLIDIISNNKLIYMLIADNTDWLRLHQISYNLPSVPFSSKKHKNRVSDNTCAHGISKSWCIQSSPICSSTPSSSFSVFCWWIAGDSFFVFKI